MNGQINPTPGVKKITSGRIGAEKITMGAEKIRSPRYNSHRLLDQQCPNYELVWNTFAHKGGDTDAERGERERERERGKHKSTV